jgi:hypothetical protein
VLAEAVPRLDSVRRLDDREPGIFELRGKCPAGPGSVVHNEDGRPHDLPPSRLKGIRYRPRILLESLVILIFGTFEDVRNCPVTTC